MAIYIGGVKVSVNIMTDADKWNFVVNLYRINLYLKSNAADLKMTDYHTPLAEWLCSVVKLTFFQAAHCTG